MSTALYRRYRPETFDDVIGQEHVTEPLAQALRAGRVNHAYLFSGPRGCGKTTSARILARCLNCENGPTPEPCGECTSCVALARGGAGAVDVVEIDAASHGGVDDARDLRERAAFGPAQARYKVYIIDEAHMVTPHGFNALLKVVEEPPEHVKFIFATTEPEKVLSTIRSRTHHYPFHLVPPQRLTGYLEELCAQEGVSLEPGVLSFVTRAGAGSVRDSLSVLDQLMAGAGTEGLTYERTAALLGFTDVELLDAVVDAVSAGDAGSVFTQIDKVMESGHDPRRFVEDLLERYRDLIVLKSVGDRSGGLLRGLPDDQVERMMQQANRYSPGALSRGADIVSRGLSEMTGAVSYRIHLELICARLLLPGADGEQGYGTRLDRIERRLSAGGPAAPMPDRAEVTPTGRPHGEEPRVDEPRAEQAAPQPPAEPPQGEGAPADPGTGASSASAESPDRPEAEQPDPAARSGPPVSDEPEVSHPGPPQQAGSIDTDAIRRAWPQVLDAVKKIRRVTWTFVSAATVIEFDGRRLVLGIGTEGQTNTFRQGNHADVVRDGLRNALGVDAQVEGVPIDGGGPGSGGSGGSNTGAASAAPPAGQAGGGGAGPTASAGDGAPVAMAEQLGAAGGAGSSRRNEPDWSSGSSDAPPGWAVGGGSAEPAAPPASDDAADVADAPSPEQDPSGDAGRTQRPYLRVIEGGDVPSVDDEDLESSGLVGQPVVENVLGGTVISIDEDGTH